VIVIAKIHEMGGPEAIERRLRLVVHDEPVGAGSRQMWEDVARAADDGMTNEDKAALIRRSTHGLGRSSDALTDAMREFGARAAEMKAAHPEWFGPDGFLIDDAPADYIPISPDGFDLIEAHRADHRATAPQPPDFKPLKFTGPTNDE